MLEIKDLNVFYGAVHAIKGISLSVGEGELVSLIGANGAGKTTTLHAISGLIPAVSGTIELNGTKPAEDISGEDNLSRSVACAGGAPRLCAYDSRGKPAHGRIYNTGLRQNQRKP